MINVKANDIIVWKDAISEKQHVSRVTDVFKCESSHNDELNDRYIYRVIDVIDYVYEPTFVYDYNILEVYKRSDR